MKFSELRVGLPVVAPADSNDPGIIVRIDGEGIAYVRFPVPGRPGNWDVIDYDPADLMPAASPSLERFSKAQRKGGKG